MRVVTNQALVKRNRRTAQYLFFFSLFLLITGFITINAPLLFPEQMTGSTEMLLTLIAPAVILPIAFISSISSVRMTNWWMRPPRPELLLEENLKLGKETVVYNYYHFPARHVLICQQGVFAIITRFQDGKLGVEGSKWTVQRGLLSSLAAAFRMDGVGNPSADAIKAAAHVESLLKPIAPNIKVQPVVMFTDPRVKLTVNQSDVAVVHAQSRKAPSLQDFIKGIPKSQYQTLTSEQIAQFEAATIK